MKTFILILHVFLIAFSTLSAQKVGVVLSGGGARGIIHIGVIKALEENNIPIDYLAGTSIGAVVGGMYAMGVSPDEIITILKSNDFKIWSMGEVEKKYMNYYLSSDPKPNVVELPVRFNRVVSNQIKPNFLPTNILPPHQMNYAFLVLFSQVNAVTNGNFDRLFVPFRCVASDIYKKEGVVFRQGVLGDVIRASMTYPLVFKPIVIDNRLLFDGGIFNNFPVDVMRDDFKPDVIIGSNVSNQLPQPNESDIISQIGNMVINRTDFSIDKNEGVLFEFENINISGFDFSKVDELEKIGYDSAMSRMDEIKARISRRMPLRELTELRKEFRARFPELKFQRVYIEGVDSLKHRYVEQNFHHNNEVFNIEDFKKAYYKLISDDKIMEVVPHAIFNPSTNNFDLHLNVKMMDRLKILLGGNISSSTSNQAYFGLIYQHLKEYAQSAYFDAQFGRMYNGLGLGSRIEAPVNKNWFMKVALVLHKFDYFEGNGLFFADYRAANFSQYEAYSKLSVGFPLFANGRMEFGVGYGALTDNYTQSADTLVYSSKLDKSIFYLGSIFGRAESSTLNNRMYATNGHNYTSLLQLITGVEIFKSTINPLYNMSGEYDNWIQFSGKIDNYFQISPQFTIGAYGELALSSRNLLQNYTASIIQAPSFRPTPHSKAVFNRAFCANQFAAIGVKPIYHLTDQLHLRAETYWFIPYKTILRASNNAAYYSAPFKSSQFLVETSLVFDFKIASAGLFANYYSAGTSRLNVGINVGILLFNRKFTE
ncbi:MAG: patatin-like phospholipase family protein [Paludibacter sp.]|nr:patatin-like phospholipase family protein [Paludibacter sp.]